MFFWKWKLSHICAKLADFFFISINLIDSLVPVFEIAKKCTITPPYSANVSPLALEDILKHVWSLALADVPQMFHLYRVGHRVLFRLVSSVLFRSLKRLFRSFPFFFRFFCNLWDPKECSFAKNVKERKECNVLLQRT